MIREDPSKRCGPAGWHALDPLVRYGTAYRVAKSTTGPLAKYIGMVVSRATHRDKTKTVDPKYLNLRTMWLTSRKGSRNAEEVEGGLQRLTSRTVMKKRKLTSRADLQPGEPLLWKKDGHSCKKAASTKSVGVYVTFSPDTRLRLEVAVDADVEKLDDRGVDKDHVDSGSDSD